MPTLIETTSLEECAALCRDLGLSFIEINMNLPQYQIDKINTDYLNELAEKYGIYYTIHLDENLNFSDFNPRVASAYCDTVLETIKIAKKINSPVLNMHLSNGVYFTLPNRKVYLFDQYREEYLHSVVEFRDKCEEVINSNNTKICIENCDGFTEFQIQAIDTILRSQSFALTFDVGHNQGINGKDEPIIIKRISRLAHMHLHDALGSKNHLALGTGEIDIIKYLCMANINNCRVVLETKTIESLKQSVNHLKEKLFAYNIILPKS